MGSLKRIGLALIVSALACGDDGGASGTGTGTNTASNTSNSTDSMTSNSEESAEDSSTSFVPAGCGNGVVEMDEQCDDGDANSDMEPNACRSNCELPTCRDEVVDMGEECDEGLDNSDFEPDTCRYECTLPSCGDAVTDQGELCDDGNDQFGDVCFECSFRWYFILNSPDLTGGGGMASILRTTRDGPPTQLVGGDASLNGMLQLAIEAGGTRLYGLRSEGGTNEVVFFNSTSGEVENRVDLGAGSPRGMVRGSDGILYIADTMGTTRLIALDPSNMNVSEALDFGSSFEVADMTSDNVNGIYITTGPGNTIEYVDISSMTPSVFGDGADGLAGPTAIAFDPDTDNMWVINNAGGGPVSVLMADLAGTFTPFTMAKTGTGNLTKALMIDVGGVITMTATDQDRIVGIALLGGVQDLFTDMVAGPYDIERVELGR